MVDPISYMICRQEACGKYVGFVRMAGNCVVVTDNPYEDARKYMSEAGAKTALYNLNNLEYSRHDWEIVKVYI